MYTSSSLWLRGYWGKNNPAPRCRRYQLCCRLLCVIVKNDVGIGQMIFPDTLVGGADPIGVYLYGAVYVIADIQIIVHFVPDKHSVFAVNVILLNVHS